MAKVIVVGANHGGIAATNRLLALGQEVTVYEKNSNVSFLGCGMALWIGNQISKADGLFYSSKDALNKAGAKVFDETTVTNIDFDKKVVYFTTKDGKQSTDTYDKIILATGSTPIVPNFPGLDLENIQIAKRYQDAELAIDKMSDKNIKTVTVVGAGYIGVELAEAFERRGKKVHLIDLADRILGTHFDCEFSNAMKDRLVKNNIQLHLGEKVCGFEGDKKVQFINTDKGKYQTDMVVLCIGFRPNFELAEGKLDLFKNKAILVNKKQETSKKDVYAIGDCATVYDNSISATNYIALATNAVRSGLIAAFNASGVEVESAGVQGSSGLCVYDLKMVSTGLSLADAQLHGIEVLHSDFEASQKPQFMNEVDVNPNVKIRVVYRKDDRTIVGCQIMSEYDMSANIHMFSLAIQEKLSIDKLALLDIFFMPHFNEPYNYITMAGLLAK